MASHASQASIALPSPATALFQAIRLCAKVSEPLKTAKLDVPPSAMAGTAEIDGIDWVELTGIEDQVRFVSGFPSRSLQVRHLLRGGVFETWPVTRFAGNPWDYPITLKRIVDRRRRGMAGETTNDLGASYGSRHGLLKIARLGKSSARSEIESFQNTEVRNAAFVEIAFSFEEVRLTDTTIAKRPRQWRRNATRAVGDRVLGLAFRPRDLVTGSARLKSQLVVPGQNV